MANAVFEQLRLEQPKTARETWQIFNDVVARFPGCAEDIVRIHVEAWLARRSKKAAARVHKTCEACGKPIRFESGKGGRKMPVDADSGNPHWGSCSDPDRFRRRRTA